MHLSKLQNLFEDLGLTKLEQKCFLSVIKKSPQRASEIAKELSVPKATILLALSRLCDEYGFVQRMKKKNTFLFLVDDVRTIEEYISRKIATLETQKKAIAALTPELRLLQTIDTIKPKVLLFDGADGLRQAFERVLTEADEIIGYGSNEDDITYLSQLYPEYYKRRVVKKIPVRALIPATSINIQETLRNEQRHLRKTHLIPKEWNYPIQINVYQGTVVFYSFKESFALMIKSKPIADCMKKIFELSFECTEEVNLRIRSNTNLSL